MISDASQTDQRTLCQNCTKHCSFSRRRRRQQDRNWGGEGTRKTPGKKSTTCSAIAERPRCSLRYSFRQK